MASRYRWFVVVLLFTVTVINYIDRSAIAFAVHQIQQEFSLGPSRTGLILGAFGIGYVISTLFGGIAVDRFGAKTAYAFSVLLWGVAIGWTGAATGFVMLYSARIALGLAEGPSFPTTTSVVTRWLPPGERAPRGLRHPTSELRSPRRRSGLARGRQLADPSGHIRLRCEARDQLLDLPLRPVRASLQEHLPVLQREVGHQLRDAAQVEAPVGEQRQL